MMTLLFENSLGKTRVIAEMDDAQSDDETIQDAIAEIKRFCKDRDFTVYYTRMWNTERDGALMTQFDVGSHSEFFYLNPAVKRNYGGLTDKQIHVEYKCGS